MDKVISKIKLNFNWIEVANYHKNIQKILDHFGVGRFKKINRIFVTQNKNDYIVFILLNTSLGNYLVIDIPSKFTDSKKIFDKIISQLGLKNSLPAHSIQDEIYLAHLGSSDFGIVKI